MKLLRIFCLCACADCCFVAPLRAQGIINEVPKYPSICGPRCVQSVLEYYGRQEDLIVLILEMQGGIPELGCSLKDIQNALEKRGIYCLALETSVLGFPDWPDPVIMHYKAGHFAVLQRIKGVYARVQDEGINREEVIPDLMFKRSGAILLTARSPIEAKQLVLLRWPRFLFALCFAFLVGFGVLAYRAFVSSGRILSWMRLSSAKNRTIRTENSNGELMPPNGGSLQG